MVVALTLFLDFVGFGMILPVLPYFALDLQASAEEVTLLATAFSLAQFVMAPVLGRWSDRRGRRPVMLLSIAGAVVSGLIVGWANALWIVFAGRLFAGACKANMSTAFAIVSDVVAPEQRAKYMGMMGAALGMGFVFGPAIGGELSSENFPTLPFFVSAGLSFVNLVMAWFWLPETHNPSENPTRVEQSRWALIQSKWGTALGWLFAVCLVFYVAFSMMEAVFALFNEAVWGWGPRETGRYLGFIGIVVALVQGGVVPRLVPRLGETRSLVWGMGTMMLGLAALAGAPDLQASMGGEGWLRSGMVAYWIGGFLLAAGNAVVSASSSVLVSLLSTREDQGLNMGLRESAAAVGRILGPMGAGVAFGQVSPSAPLWIAAGLCLAILPVAQRVRAS